jgi:hypothetical protein
MARIIYLLYALFAMTLRRRIVAAHPISLPPVAGRTTTATGRIIKRQVVVPCYGLRAGE